MNDHLTKTGSGQKWGKHSKWKGAFCVSRSQEEVQGTINKIITSEHLTVVVIAHRCGARISFMLAPFPGGRRSFVAKTGSGQAHIRGLNKRCAFLSVPGGQALDDQGLGQDLRL
jgi:hypothetical protein